ncbi:MAG: hypothetical protein AAFQ62_09490 [Pseudomonadota bacterium]
MRRAHRKAHVALWLLIAPALVAVLYLALSARQSVPVNDALPEVLQTEGAP